MEEEEAVCTLFEHELATVVWGVAAQVLLDIGVLVVVDPHTLVPCSSCQPLDETRLSHGRLSLDQHRMAPTIQQLGGLQMKKKTLNLQ